MAVRFTSRIKDWTNDTSKKLDLAVLSMATDIHRVATTLAPEKTGALVNSGKVVRIGLGHYAITFGGGSVRYAKRRHYENKLHPGTLKYLERAGDATSRNAGRYFKGI